jgi:hypothetical protein
VLFGAGVLAPNRHSLSALRFATLGLGFALCLLGGMLGLRLGAPQLLTVVVFSGMAFSYLALVTLGFLIAALAANRKRPDAALDAEP